ncbi:GNAT family N-acetyltransferase [Blautia sp.]|nr:GNAT family N-acetyltransferase [Blautia sp.]MEE0810003.1 GNAT family N-acetyltransferase [Blautia sp.]
MEYPAELALFAVDSSCRGKGIGKQLFQSAIDYMKQEQLDKFLYL